MDIISHGLIGGLLSVKQKSKKNIFWVVFFSVLADLFFIPAFFYLGHTNKRFLWIPANSDWLNFSFYHPYLDILATISHSFIFAFLIILPLIFLFKLPKMAFFAYLIHIFIDILTHTGEFNIKLFYPLSDWAIGGFTDAWGWPIWQMSISWIIISAILIFALKKNGSIHSN